MLIASAACWIKVLTYTTGYNDNTKAKRKFKLLFLLTFWIFRRQNHIHYSVYIAYGYQFHIFVRSGKNELKNVIY